MFIDFDKASLAELEALAETLPGPHAWAWGTANVFYCRTCAVAVEWGEAIPDEPCEPIDTRA